MAVWSIVNFAAAWKEQRFDPEFWQPIYLASQEAVAKWPLLGEYLRATQYGLSRDMNDAGQGIPIYRMDEMDDLFLTRPEKYAEVTEEEQAALLLKRNDVLFNRTNSTKFVGRTGILKDDVTAIFASYLIRLIPDTSQLLPEYLAVYLNCPTGSKLVKRRAKESINQTNISGSEVRKVPILIPSDGVQEKVAALVEAAADSRSKINRSYAEAEAEMLERLGWAKLVKPKPGLWYVENYRTVAGAGRCDPEFFSPRAKVLYKMLNRDGRGIGDVADLATRHFDSKPRVPFRYIEITDVNEIGQFSTVTVPGEEAPDRAKWLVEEGDVLTSTVRPIRRLTGVVAKDQAGSVCSSGFAVLSPKDVEPEVLLVYLRLSPVCELLDVYTTASMYPAISTTDLLRIPITLPPKDSRQRIVAKVRVAWEAKVKAWATLEEAKTLVEQEIEKCLK